MTVSATAASLAEQLAATIRLSGPITIAHYMAEAVANQTHGYYSTRDPFGLEGDFITAPEVSQIFGELLGLWCADLWAQMDRPKMVNLVELGPGRGTLMPMRGARRRLRPAFIRLRTSIWSKSVPCSGIASNKYWLARSPDPDPIGTTSSHPSPRARFCSSPTNSSMRFRFISTSV